MPRKPPDDDQPSLFDLARAKAAREAGIELATAANEAFMDNAMRVIEALKPGSHVTGEVVRKRCEQLGIRPKTPKSWGALTMDAIRRGLLVPTGQYVTPHDVKSHACKKPSYIRTDL